MTATAIPSADRRAWRLDDARHAAIWDSGEGAYLFGGRWNSKGVRAVYCSMDASTALLEVAVHKGFDTLDRVPHVLSELAISAEPHAIDPSAMDPSWLEPGLVDPAQQMHGDGLLAAHGIILVPSVVSRHAWNLVIEPSIARGSYRLLRQERFVLDPRLNRPPEG